MKPGYLIAALVPPALLAVLGCALALGEIPRTIEPIRDTAEVCEVNNFYDDCGKLVFVQIILWDHNGICVAWRLLKCPRQVPQRDWQRGGYVATWDDSGLWREIRVRTLVESWTQYDPELCQRERWPQEYRRGLTPGRAK